MNCGLSEKHLMIIQEILAPHQAITHAILFGSRARGAFKPASDVDIALKGAITIRLIAKIKAEFEESNLPFFVDIVDYAKTNDALKSEIDMQGILLYVKDISHFSNTYAISKDCTLTSKDDKSSPCHSKRSEESQKSDCHSEPALAGEESIGMKSHRDISLTLNMTSGGVCHSKPSFCHSEALAEESQKSDCHTKIPFCHSELEHSESEESSQNRDVSASPQHDNITLTQNQIAFSKYPAFTYILTNKNNTTLYIGVTSNLQKRIYEHKNHLAKGFSNKYNCEKLVYFESFEGINQAIEREKYLKGKRRDFKENLIHSINPKWLDLYDYLFSCHSGRNEESNRDISLVSQAQYDNKGRK